jgi:hypothetical protein
LALKPTHWNLFREHCGAIYRKWSPYTGGHSPGCCRH